MRVVVVNPPDPVVSWAELDHHIRLSGDTTEQTYVESLAAAATAHIDGPAGWLGRAIGEQDLEARFDSFGCGELELPCPEIQLIDSVIYIDGNGDEQTIDAGDYRLIGRILAPAYGKSWPSPRYEREAVRVTYLAGYETVPQAIKAAILMMADDMFNNRGSVVNGTISSSVQMSTTIENLLGPFRVYT